MPDNRYDGYEQRPRQGAENMNGGVRRNAPQAGGQSRPAQTRPQTAANRPVNAAPRQAAPRQGNQASGTTARAPQRPAASGQARPASAQSRPAQPRPQTAAQGRPRPAQTGAQQRRTSQYEPVRQSASAQNRPRTYGSAKRPVSRQGYGYSGASTGGFQMAPAAKAALFVLMVALLMTISVIVADKIRSAQPRPVITMNTQDSLSLNQATDQPQTTNAPVNPTDAPAASTDEPAASTEPTNVPAAPVQNQTQTAGDRSVTIRAIGDVIIDQATLDNCAIVKNEEYDFSPLFELVGGVMADADWTMINIEGTLRKHKYGYMGFPSFYTPHSILEDLKAVGVDMLTMCNNHALDGWFDGLKISLDYADAAGLAHVGAYRTQEEHDTPEVYDIGGIKVGMLNYTQYTNGMASNPSLDKAAIEYGMRLMDGADYAGDIAALKNAGAEFVIAVMHWGTEYVREPDDDIEVIAQRLVAAGADLVIGGHPHVVQPAEYVTATQADGTQNTALVIYSLGNFYSEHRHKNQPYTDNGVIFEFTLSDNGSGQIEMSNPAFIPIYMWQTEGAGAYEFRAVPSGVYLNNPPAGMSGSEYERMKESYNELVDLIGGVIEIKDE